MSPTAVCRRLLSSSAPGVHHGSDATGSLATKGAARGEATPLARASMESVQCNTIFALHFTVSLKSAGYPGHWQLNPPLNCIGSSSPNE